MNISRWHEEDTHTVYRAVIITNSNKDPENARHQFYGPYIKEATAKAVASNRANAARYWTDDAYGYAEKAGVVWSRVD